MNETGDLRARLIDRAVALLDKGADAVSLRAVAKAAGVSAMAPYRHFADKTALLAAVAEAGFEALRIRLIAADAVEDNGEALLGQALAYIAFAQERPALFRLMFGGYCEPKGAAGPSMDDDSAYGVLARRVARLRPDDAMAATLAAWSIVHGVATLTLDQRLPPDPAPTRAALALFVAGLRV